MNKKLKIFIIILILIGVASIIVWKYIAHKEDYYNAVPKEKFSNIEILNELSTSDSIKLKALKDVLIEVCGEITNIKIDNNIPIIEMGMEGSMNSITFQMDQQYIKEVEALQNGKQLCIKGIFAAYTVDDLLGATIEMKYCVISH